MELKTQALDRLLEVLSPALAKELERIVSETREELEQEFQTRMRDAERAIQTEADAQLQRSLRDLHESTRKDVKEEFEQRFKATLEEHINKLQTEFAIERQRLESERQKAETERQRLEQDLTKWRVFGDAQRQFAEASTQTEILVRFLKLAEPFAGGLAIYVTKADGLGLWKSRGSAAFPEIISERSTDPESYFRTILVRGKVVAAVCASAPLKTEMIDFLVTSVERAIELFGLKLRTPAPRTVAAAEASQGSNV